MSDITVRIDSCLVSDDGQTMLVCATLHDGRHVVDATIPAQSSREALAAYLMTDAPTFRIVTGFSGNVSIPAPVVAEVVEASDAPTDDAPTTDAAPADAPVKAKK